MKRAITKTSTSFAFAIAAFAVTITNVQAFGSHEFLINAGLNDDQVVAVQEARELRRLGDIVAARDVLVAAGIDEEVIADLRQAHRSHAKQTQHWLQQQIDEQLTDQERDALLVARRANDQATVQAILAEAGIERPDRP